MTGRRGEGAGGTAVADRVGPLAVKAARAGRGLGGAGDGGADRPAGPFPAAGSIIGRAAELAEARAAVAQVAAGQAAVLTIVGEPGIGKSRLAAETVDHARRLGFTTAAGASRALGPETSYLPWRAIWRDLLGLDPWSSVAEQREALAARFGEQAPLLGPVLNLPSPTTSSPARWSRRNGPSCFGPSWPASSEASRSVPLALLVEDAHWIDPSSRALLEHLARALADQPLLLAVTARPTDSGRQVTEALAEVAPPPGHPGGADPDRRGRAGRRAGHQVFGDQAMPPADVLGGSSSGPGATPSTWRSCSAWSAAAAPAATWSCRTASSGSCWLGSTSSARPTRRS